jgi:hypothetical protein
MSEESLDSLDRADEQKDDDDVEAHNLDAAVDAPHAATEEPPDVEGHSFDSMDSMDSMDAH